MKAIGKLGILKTIGEKQFAILNSEDNTIIMKIDINDWLMDKLGDAIYYQVTDNSFHLNLLYSNRRKKG